MTGAQFKPRGFVIDLVSQPGMAGVYHPATRQPMLDLIMHNVEWAAGVDPKGPTVMLVTLLGHPIELRAEFAVCCRHPVSGELKALRAVEWQDGWMVDYSKPLRMRVVDPGRGRAAVRWLDLDTDQDLLKRLHIVQVRWRLDAGAGAVGEIETEAATLDGIVKMRQRQFASYEPVARLLFLDGEAYVQEKDASAPPSEPVTH